MRSRETNTFEEAIFTGKEYGFKLIINGSPVTEEEYNLYKARYLIDRNNCEHSVARRYNEVCEFCTFCGVQIR